jgi:hypothetical protein
LLSLVKAKNPEAPAVTRLADENWGSIMVAKRQQETFEPVTMDIVGGAAASSAWPLAARAQQQAAKLLAAQCGGLRRRYCFTYRRRAILAVQPA